MMLGVRCWVLGFGLSCYSKSLTDASFLDKTIPAFAGMTEILIMI
jgi:hypothetical protein